MPPRGDAAEGPHAQSGHVVEADDAAADIRGRVQLDGRLRRCVERQLEQARTDQQSDSGGHRSSAMRKGEQRQAPQDREPHRVRDVGLSLPHAHASSAIRDSEKAGQ